MQVVGMLVEQKGDWLSSVPFYIIYKLSNFVFFCHFEKFISLISFNVAIKVSEIYHPVFIYSAFVNIAIITHIIVHRNSHLVTKYITTFCIYLHISDLTVLPRA